MSKNITTPTKERNSFWQNFFGSGDKVGTEVAIPTPKLKLNGTSSTYGYNANEYNAQLFPYQAEIVAGGYEDNWREELKDFDAGEWLYRTHKDILRKRVVYIASKTSLNSVQIKKPTEEANTLSIEIKQASDRPLCISLQVDGSHLVDSNYKNEIQVRFDDDDAVTYRWEKDCGFRSIDTIHIYEDAGDLFARLRTAKYMIIEVCFYTIYGRNGNHHYEVFIVDVSDLEWVHETRRLGQTDSSSLIEAADADDDPKYLESFVGEPEELEIEDFEIDAAFEAAFEEPLEEPLEEEAFEEPAIHVFTKEEVANSQNPESKLASDDTDVQIRESDTDNNLRI